MSSSFAYMRAAQRRSPEWYFQQRRERLDRKNGYDGWRLRLEQIADRDNFFRCFQQLKSKGGPGAGVDGLHAADLSPSEAGELAGALSVSVLSGNYLPRKVRPVPIPKPGTKEHRILKISVLADRIVGKALHNAWGPFWEERFKPCSYGFRPHRSTWMMLADLEERMHLSGRTVLAIEDVRKAFDNVPIQEVVSLHEKALARVKQQNFSSADRQRTLHLVETVLRGHDTNRTRGIDQGGPYSPAALNVLLHYTLDVPMMEYSGNKPLWHRYADNLVYLASCVSDGKQVLNKVATLLQPLGLSLKGNAGVVDLSHGGPVQLLGFSLQWKEGRIFYEIGSDAWDTLRQHLCEAHSREQPPLTAQQSVLGWLDALGPAFENGDVATVLSLAADYGFREISLDRIRERWRESWKRWRVCQARSRRRNRRWC